uniref:DNA-directed RNA polymerase III subunit RPC8 n=1 Tax=Strigamia maritima TaxID=126957 RepID=T1J1V3_STRMM
MFILTEFTTTVRVPPSEFGIPLHEAVSKELNKKLANKVVHNTGLSITLFDITSLGESFIIPGDGASHTKVLFRYVVFRPFVNELIVGKIKKCSPEGVHVSLGFFDDIIIPPDALQHPSRFVDLKLELFSDESEQIWIWEYVTDDEKHELFIEPNGKIRFRVVDETFVDTSPSGSDSIEATPDDIKVPYLITGSINESGLGPLCWWSS